MTQEQFAGATIATIVTVVLLTIEHHFPWELLRELMLSLLSHPDQPVDQAIKLITDRRVHPVMNYAFGILAIEIPYSILLLLWGYLPAAVALWIITIAGGAAVGVAYLLDDYIGSRRRAMVEQDENGIMRVRLLDVDDHATTGRN